MDKKCENCYWYRQLLGGEYCSLDAQLREDKRKKYEIMCNRFISKNASFGEQVNYVKKHRRKDIKLQIWDETKHKQIENREQIRERIRRLLEGDLIDE